MGFIISHNLDNDEEEKNFDMQIHEVRSYIKHGVKAMPKIVVFHLFELLPL
jgi:hypothetical protein